MFYIIDHNDLSKIAYARKDGSVEFAYQEVALIFGEKEGELAEVYSSSGGEIRFLVETPERKAQIVADYQLQESNQ